MRRNLYLYLTVQQLIFITYFTLTTAIFFLALNYGNEGVSIQLFGGGDDGLFYWEQAQNLAKGQSAVITSIYTVIIANLIKITGIENVYLIRIFNYFGFILLVIFSIYLIKSMFRIENIKIHPSVINNASILLLICFLFYASLLMNVNLSIYRDVWIYMLYVLSTMLSIKVIFRKKGRWYYLTLLIPILWLLGGFRKYALLAFMLSIIIYFTYKKIIRLKSPILVGVSLLLIFGIYYTYFMDYIVPVVNMSLRSVLNYRLSSLTIYSGGSQMWINLEQSNYIMFLINYIHSYVGNLIGPLPWHISNKAMGLVFFIETIPMSLILIYIWKKRKLLSNVQKYILTHAFIWISLIAVSNDNIGTATRLRPVAWILILIVFVVVYARGRYLRKNKDLKVVG